MLPGGLQVGRLGQAGVSIRKYAGLIHASLSPVLLGPSPSRWVTYTWLCPSGWPQKPCHFCSRSAAKLGIVMGGNTCLFPRGATKPHGKARLTSDPERKHGGGQHQPCREGLLRPLGTTLSHHMDIRQKHARCWYESPVKWHRPVNYSGSESLGPS